MSRVSVRKFGAAAAIWLALACAAPGAAQSSPEAAVPPADGGTAAGQGPEAAPPEAAGESSQRTTLNLLGEVDSGSGEARRNENVKLTLIDNNVLKELNTRMGVTATAVTEFEPDHRYFGTEFGGDPRRPVHFSAPAVSGFHGELFWTHGNSALSARSFFQVGAVQPARSNDYGVNAGLDLWRGASLSLNASQGKLRGQVNGNVLVPGADERTPLTADPDDRKIVEAILSAYPKELPNRTDINRRALNTNAPQLIDNDRLGGVLDQQAGGNGHIALHYQFTLQNVEAFQLVGGQNPDTTTRNHSARATWSRAWSPATATDFSLGFDRTGSLLVPEETSLGVFYLFSRELESLGPGGDIPIDRSQNLFRGGGRVRQVKGNHSWTLGFEVLRRQINGYESNEHRGVFSFREDYGRDTVTNLRMGTASVYMTAAGHIHRGFREWLPELYAGDVWRATPRLTVSAGLRYESVTRPTEVNRLSAVPYDSDLNNLAPSLGLAYRLPGSWGVLRAAYGLHYGEIFPATFMQVRFNPPQNVLISVRAPKLADPLGDLNYGDIDPNGRSSLFQLAPELCTPYVHQYGFTWQFSLPREVALELAYTGSRSHKLLAMWYLNRARPVEGIPQITQTIDARRPDQRYYDIHHMHNGSRGYYDAAKVTLRLPRAAGLTGDVAYWFSKAIDLGTSYTNTASGSDGREARSPSEDGFQEEMRGLSDFDQPHAALARLNYELPALVGWNRWLSRAIGGWQLSSVVLVKSGAPFTVQTGGDSPGWGNVDGAGSDNPILLDPSILGRAVDHPDTAPASLPRSAFTTIQPTDRRGNLGRNTFRKDGIGNVNLGLSRRWAFAGDKWLSLRAESLNLLNHPQFAEPGLSLTSANFAQITNTLNDGRSFRFTLGVGF